MREKHRMERVIQDQKKRYKSGFEVGERVRVQETAAKGKQWKYTGTIREQTAGKDSFIIDMDNGERIRRHKRFIRAEKGEDENDSSNEETGNADPHCTLRAGAVEEEEEPRWNQVLHGRIVNADQNKNEVSR